MAKERKISIAKLERDIGMSPQTAKKWREFMPNAKTLSELADYFDVSVDYLLGRETTYTQEEVDLIKAFRLLPEEQKSFVLDSVKASAAKSPLKKDTKIS